MSLSLKGTWCGFETQEPEGGNQDSRVCLLLVNHILIPSLTPGFPPKSLEIN